jgi:hypothetical protein
MLEPLRKTVNLVREHPSLWLPLVCVSLADFYLEWLQKIFVRKVNNWFLTAHSALGFTFQAPHGSSPSYLMRAGLLTLPTSLGIRVLIFSVYIVGFFLTARMVRALIQEQRPDWASDAILCKARLWRILFFSLKIFVIFIFAAVLAYPFLNLSIFAFLRNNLSFRVLTMGTFFIACIFLAWIFIPLSLKIIADWPSGSIPSATKTQGRIAAIIVALISIALNNYSSAITPLIRFKFEADFWLRNLVIWPGLTIAVNLPLALLWVFLGVLAFEDLQLPEIPSPS